MSDLLPCPFCGGNLFVNGLRIARCDNDDCFMRAKMTVDLDDPEQIDAWNTRADLPRPEDAARIAELEEEVASLKADAERAKADGHQNLCELEDQDARIAELTDALSRIVTPAPGVTEPAPPWAVGIARAALAADA